MTAPTPTDLAVAQIAATLRLDSALRLLANALMGGMPLHPMPSGKYMTCTDEALALVAEAQRQRMTEENDG